MRQVEAAKFDRVKSATVTADSSHVLFELSAKENIARIAIPAEQLWALMSLVSLAASHVEQQRKQDNRVRHTFPCEALAVRQPTSGQGIVLDFTIPGGMVLSVEIDVAKAGAMQTLLATPSQPRTAPGRKLEVVSTPTPKIEPTTPHYAHMDHFHFSERLVPPSPVPVLERPRPPAKLSAPVASPEPKEKMPSLDIQAGIAKLRELLSHRIRQYVRGTSAAAPTDRTA